MRLLHIVITVLLIQLWTCVAIAEESIRIGAIFSLSGWGAGGGTSELNGALLARDDINAAGGIGGKPVKIIPEDNQSDLKNTASAFRKLVSVDKVAALVGPNWSEFSEVVVPLAESARVPLVSPSGWKEGLFDGRRFAFTLLPPHSVSTAPMAGLFKKMQFRKVAVLLSENSYLQSIYDALEQQLKAVGIELVPLMRFNQGQNDFRSAIVQLTQAKPDAVLALLTENGDLSNFFLQYRQMKLQFPLFTANGIPFDNIIRKNPSIAEGVTYFDFLIPGDEEFQNRYRARFGGEPGIASAKAYDALYVVKAAIEKCGMDPEALRSCISKIKYTGRSGHISFDSDGVTMSRERNTQLFKVSGGKFEILKDDAA